MEEEYTNINFEDLDLKTRLKMEMLECFSLEVFRLVLDRINYPDRMTKFRLEYGNNKENCDETLEYFVITAEIVPFEESFLDRVLEELQKEIMFFEKDGNAKTCVLSKDKKISLIANIK